MWALVLLYIFNRPTSNRFISYGGGGRIRTCVALRAADLQSAPINHSGTPPDTTPLKTNIPSPRGDSNPLTYRLGGCDSPLSPDSIAVAEIGVKSYTEEDMDKLHPIISALRQLPPRSQDLATNLIRQLAEQENIIIPLVPSAGLQSPTDGIGLWEADMIALGRSSNTITIYKGLLATYLRDDPEPTKLSIMQFVSSKLIQTSPIGAGNYIRALKSLFGFLVEAGLWNVNPTIGIKKPKVGKKVRVVPTEEEIGKLVNTLITDTDYHRNKPKAMAWIIGLITTGCRRSELLGLSWNEVDLENGKMTVLGKGNKQRTVPLHPITIGVLDHYRATLAEGEPQVFPSKDQRGMWDVKASNLMIERLCIKAGIPRYTAHQFRHYYATYMRRHGAKLETVSKLLGHASVAITADIYEHFTDEEIAEEHKLYAPLTQPLLEEGKEDRGD